MTSQDMTSKTSQDIIRYDIIRYNKNDISRHHEIWYHMLKKTMSLKLSHGKLGHPQVIFNIWRHNLLLLLNLTLLTLKKMC